VTIRAGNAPAEGTVAAPLDAIRVAYIETCSRYLQGEVPRVGTDIASLDATIAELGARLRVASRERSVALRRRTTVEAMLAEDDDRFGRAFDDLLGLRGVRAIEVDQGRVRVLTHPVTIVHEDDRFLIGDFAVDVDLDHGVRVMNLSNTNERTGWDHPHVQGTVPCLGNLQEGCEILLGQLELVPLVSLLLQFLETYTPATAYCAISRWQRLDA
jgi:hypothetical protein